MEWVFPKISTSRASKWLKISRQHCNISIFMWTSLTYLRRTTNPDINIERATAQTTIILWFNLFIFTFYKYRNMRNNSVKYFELNLWCRSLNSFIYLYIHIFSTHSFLLFSRMCIIQVFFNDVNSDCKIFNYIFFSCCLLHKI